MNRVLPILFNTEMVRAILDGRKTATRRLIKKSQCMFFTKKEPLDYLLSKKDMYAPYNTLSDAEFIASTYKPPYKPGDILYVRETWCGGYDGEVYFYLADKNTHRELRYLINYDERKWRPSIHMPKEAARIWLKVTDVRVERLKDIDDAGIVAEGLEIGAYFDDIWNSTIKKALLSLHGWDANPWVWVIEFDRYKKPCEQKGKSQ